MKLSYSIWRWLKNPCIILVQAPVPPHEQCLEKFTMPSLLAYAPLLRSLALISTNYESVLIWYLRFALPWVLDSGKTVFWSSSFIISARVKLTKSGLNDWRLMRDPKSKYRFVCCLLYCCIFFGPICARMRLYSLKVAKWGSTYWVCILHIWC